MSFQAMTWATAQPLKALDKLVLIMLANYANHLTGQCNPSHDRLANECGMSRSTLKASIARLEETGLLTIERRSADGVALPNQYHLAIPDAEPTGWAGSRPTPPAADRGVGREPATNQESQPVGSSSRRAVPACKLDLSKWPGTVTLDVLAEWQSLRQRKRAPVTQLVIDRMAPELHKAAAIGYTVDEALTEAVFRGWQGFRADWLEPRNGKPQPVRAGAGTASPPHGRHDYARGGQGGNGSRQGGAIDRVLANARERAEAAAAAGGAGSDHGDDDVGVRPPLDFSPR